MVITWEQFLVNGLRPSRYYITDDDQLILSSEVGVLEIDPAKIVVKERLRPGRMLLVDTVNGKLIDDDELKESYATRKPYGEWLNNNLVNLKDIHIPNVKVETYEKEERQRLQKTLDTALKTFRELFQWLTQEMKLQRQWVRIHHLQF